MTQDNSVVSERGSSAEAEEPLKPLGNLYKDDTLSWEGDTVRCNIFSNVLNPHFHEDEDGVIVFLNGSANGHIGSEHLEGRVIRGSVFGFAVRDWHGFTGGGKSIVFHGYKPFKKAEGYTVIKAELTEHPEGGYNKKVVWKLDGDPVEQPWFVMGPDVNMTLGATLRALDAHARKLIGLDSDE